MNISSSYSPRLIKSILISGAVGNILETYDLILISLMAITLSRVFFPTSSDPYAHLIDVLYVFFMSLLMRPLGNILMALFADQIGRKKLMFVSLAFTGICSIAIGLLLGYQSIGIWATLLFILIRISMNFFAGIEYVNSATYLIENSTKNTRGFYGSWSAIGISGGYLLASFVSSFFISYFISKHVIPEWSWRFVFLFSVIGIVFGIWIRCSIPESFEFILNNTDTQRKKKLGIYNTDTQRKKKLGILKKSFQFIIEHPKQCVSIGALTIMGTCLSFIYYVYIPLTLITTRHFNHIDMLGINVVSLSLVILLIPLFGKISDYYNRIELMKIPCLMVSLLSLPFFWAASYGTYSQILFWSLLISIPSSCFFSLYPTVLIEMFPSKIRCTASSLIYQIVFSLVLGDLPLFVAYLIRITKLPYSPAYLLIFSSLIGFMGLLFLQQSGDKLTMLDTRLQSLSS